MVGGFLFFHIKENINPSSSIQSPSVIIKDHVIEVEIADEFNEWSQGLSNREFMEENKGMLFVFPGKQIRRFWMKDMNFPLDIVWLDDNKIIKIDQNAQPEGNSPTRRYSSPMPINYVLEVNAGWCNQNNIKVGNIAEFNL